MYVGGFRPCQPDELGSDARPIDPVSKDGLPRCRPACAAEPAADALAGARGGSDELSLDLAGAGSVIDLRPGITLLPMFWRSPDGVLKDAAGLPCRDAPIANDCSSFAERPGGTAREAGVLFGNS